MTPIRVQLSRKKGWRMPPNTVSVARPTKWGNPFIVGGNPSRFSIKLPDHCDTISDSIECYRYYAKQWGFVTKNCWLSGLRGKNLACWCPLDHPCHADVLLEMANKT